MRVKWVLVCIKMEDLLFYDWYFLINSDMGGNIDNVIINFYWIIVVVNCWYCECMIYKLWVFVIRKKVDFVDKRNVFNFVKLV